MNETHANHAGHVKGAPARIDSVVAPEGMSHEEMAHDAMAHDAMGHHDAHGEHGGGHGDHVGQFRRLFWIMLAVAIPVVGFSHMFAMIIGYELPALALVPWVSPLLGTVMYIWGGRPFLTGAVSEIKARKPGMMLLIALAITVAFIASWGASLGILNAALDFWWELALLIVIMLLGRCRPPSSGWETSSSSVPVVGSQPMG